MPTYSKAEKTLHRFYLSNYFISRATMEMEEILYGRKAGDINIKECIFITGLARSGTTALMNKIFNTGKYASLQYSNMPMLLAPNLWKKNLNIESHQRAHQDGIKIDGNSPEEFDEYFWKAFLKDSYIQEDGLIPHDVNDSILEKYKTYIRLICYAKGKNKYISKNNNNILRLTSLEKIAGSKIIVLYREPLSHASSLLKLHKRFSNTQTDDPFELEYFNFLGHHEFGIGHKPFLLTPAFTQRRQLYPKDELEYWLISWINYYQYLLDLPAQYTLVCFEDLITNENMVLKHLSNDLAIGSIPTSNSTFSPPDYKNAHGDPSLLSEAKNLYSRLKSLTDY